MRKGLGAAIVQGEGVHHELVKSARPIPNWLALLIVALLALGVSLYRIGDSAIYWWDEARVALNSLEMMHSRNPLIVTFNGQADLWNSKPPLAIWLNALSMRVFGVNEFALRLPAALASVGTTLAVFRFTDRISDRGTAFLAALILLGIGGYAAVHVTRTADYDSLLVLFTTLATFSVYLAFESKQFYPAAGYGLLSLLTKGTAALMMVPGYALYALIYRKDLRRAVLPGLALLGGVTLYLFARELSERGYLHAIYFEEVLRFGRPADRDDHRELAFYLRELLWPWQTSLWDPYWSASYLISAFPWSWLAFLSLLRPSKVVIYLWCCTVTFIVTISIAVTQHPWYIAPAYPLIAVLAAVGVKNTIDVVRVRSLFLFFAALAVLCIGLNIWKVNKELEGVMTWRERGQASLIGALPLTARARVTPDVVWRTPAVRDGKIIGTELYFGAVEFYRRTRPAGAIQIVCVAPAFERDSGRAKSTSCYPPNARPKGPTIDRLPDSRIVAIP